jgi:signal transduction histidine kinase
VKERILYADDEIANRLVFEQTFEKSFEVVTVENGADALRKLGEREFAVLLSDQRMPGMSGNELLRRARESHPATERIILTAYDDVEPILSALNSGLVSRYIVKPWVRQELESAILGCIEIHRLRRDKVELTRRLFNAERFSSLGVLAAGVVHDAKQPLTSFRSNVPWMLELLPLFTKLQQEIAAGRLPDLETTRGDGVKLKLGTALPELPAVLEELDNAGRSLQDLMENARGLLGQDGGRGEPTTAARRALGLCRGQLRASSIQVDSEIPENLPFTKMSTPVMIQVLVNFLVNSIQAMVPGRSGTIRFRMTREADGVTLSVADNGQGMSPEVLARVREPFFTTKPVGVGTGLGLFCSQQLIAEAGGKLEISSRQHEGTTVSVWLPGG